jgi:hypothetical protein
MSKSKSTINTVTSRDGKQTISAEEFESRFERGEDISQFMDLQHAQRPGRDVQRVNVDFPKPFLSEIDEACKCIGVTRQSWIKTAVADYLARHKRPDKKKASASNCRGVS